MNKYYKDHEFKRPPAFDVSWLPVLNPITTGAPTIPGEWDHCVIALQAPRDVNHLFLPYTSIAPHTQSTRTDKAEYLGNTPKMCTTTIIFPAWKYIDVSIH